MTGVTLTAVDVHRPYARKKPRARCAGCAPYDRLGMVFSVDGSVPPKIPPVSVRHRADSFRVVPLGQGEVPVFPLSSATERFAGLTFNP
jgi:hypothetical protein